MSECTMLGSVFSKRDIGRYCSGDGSDLLITMYHCRDTLCICIRAGSAIDTRCGGKQIKYKLLCGSVRHQRSACLVLRKVSGHFGDRGHIAAWADYFRSVFDILLCADFAYFPDSYSGSGHDAQPGSFFVLLGENVKNGEVRQRAQNVLRPLWCHKIMQSLLRLILLYFLFAYVKQEIN